MNQKEIVLAALAASKGQSHTPVQTQKLLFIIDQKIPQSVDGPHFDFQPYDYGPFDKNVYSVLNELYNDGDVEILYEGQNNLRHYNLTNQGQSKGKKLLESLDKSASEYICQLSHFVISQPFAKLVSAVYRAFPEMKVNSIFRG